MKKYTKAIELLSLESARLGGIIYSRYVLEYLKQHKEELSNEVKEKIKSAESMQFFEQLMTGKLQKENQVIDVESCEEYKQLIEVTDAILKLRPSSSN